MPNPITSYNDLLAALRSRPGVSGSTTGLLADVVHEALGAGVRLSDAEIAKLVDEACGGAFVGGEMEQARTFVGGSPRQCPADVPERQALFEIFAKLRAPEPAAHNPKLDALGFDAETGTIQRLRKAHAVAAARECGPLLSAHTAIYKAFLTESLLRTLRVHTADYLRARSEEYAAAALSIERAPSVTAVLQLLASTPHLKGALKHAAMLATEPTRQILTDIVKQPQAELAAAVRALEEVAVAIVDILATGRIDERDILAMEVGRTSLLAPVGRELSDRLRLSACIQEAIAAFAGADGCRFEFAAGSFSGPEDYFRFAGSSFKLRHEQAPDRPWLTRAKSAAAALEHLKSHAEAYVMDCSAAELVVWLLGRHREICELAGSQGDAIFDKVNPHILIGKLDDHVSNALVHHEVDVDPRLDVPLPGDARYFRTPDVSPAGKLCGWMGENVLFYKLADEDAPGWNKGERIWFGHPFGLTSERQILRRLNSTRFGINPLGIPALAPAQAALQRVTAHEPAIQALAASLTELGSLLDRYEAKREEYESFMKEHERAYKNARAHVDGRRPDPAQAPEAFADYQAAGKVFDSLAKKIAQHDREVEDLAAAANRLREELLAAAERSCRLDLPAAALQAIGQLLVALRGLAPSASALHAKGRVLEPYRRFQERDVGNPRLL